MNNEDTSKNEQDLSGLKSPESHANSKDGVSTIENPAQQESSRNPDGTFKKGVSGNPAGKKPGKSIKERIKDYLEDHPEEMAKFVDYFVKENRDLAWQMLEGRPSQGIGQAEDLEKLNVGVVMLPVKNEDTLGTTTKTENSPS